MLSPSRKNQCQRARRKLSEYLDGRLSPRQRPGLEAHLARCPGCRQELESLRLTVSLLRRVPEVAAPHSFAVVAAERAPQALPVRGLRVAAVLATLLLGFALLGDLFQVFEKAMPLVPTPPAVAEELMGAGALPTSQPGPEEGRLPAVTPSPEAKAPPGSPTPAPAPPAPQATPAWTWRAEDAFAPKALTRDTQAEAGTPLPEVTLSPEAIAGLTPTTTPPPPTMTPIPAIPTPTPYLPPAAPESWPWRPLEFSFLGLAVLLGGLSWLAARRRSK